MHTGVHNALKKQCPKKYFIGAKYQRLLLVGQKTLCVFLVKSIMVLVQVYSVHALLTG